MFAALVAADHAALRIRRVAIDPRELERQRGEHQHVLVETHDRYGRLGRHGIDPVAGRKRATPEPRCAADRPSTLRYGSNGRGTREVFLVCRPGVRPVVHHGAVDARAPAGQHEGVTRVCGIPRDTE